MQVPEANAKNPEVTAKNPESNVKLDPIYFVNPFWINQGPFKFRMHVTHNGNSNGFYAELVKIWKVTWAHLLV